MKIDRNILLSAGVLIGFAVVGAGFVGLTHDNTLEQIEHNQRLTLLKKLNTILPASAYDNDLLQSSIELPAHYMLGTDEPTTAYIAKKADENVAVILTAISPNGYNGPIELLIGIRTDGSIAGTRVTRHRETPGLGDAVEERKSDWINKFTGRSLSDPTTRGWKVKRDGGEFDQFTGATITPRAVVKAIHSALIYFDDNRERLLGTPDEENKP